jgi:hypothetical protein
MEVVPEHLDIRCAKQVDAVRHALHRVRVPEGFVVRHRAIGRAADQADPVIAVVRDSIPFDPQVTAAYRLNPVARAPRHAVARDVHVGAVGLQVDAAIRGVLDVEALDVDPRLGEHGEAVVAMPDLRIV